MSTSSTPAEQRCDHRVTSLTSTHVVEVQKVPVLALRIDDRISVGLERFELITDIDDREPGVVKVCVSSGIVHRFSYRDTVTVEWISAPSIAHLPERDTR